MGLYNIHEDFSRANKLFEEPPEKLKEPRAAFAVEARKYNVYPLDSSMSRAPMRWTAPPPGTRVPLNWVLLLKAHSWQRRPNVTALRAPNPVFKQRGRVRRP